jgi:diketogulonate reductase-like aldo/keto reductase
MRTLEIADLTVPTIGLGTWELWGDEGYRAIRTALDIGYRHLDTATFYDNEDVVGRAIADSAIDRGDVFVTTKVWPSRADAAGVHASIEGSLGRLRLSHVDLLLLHWPAEQVAPLQETLTALLAVRDRGLTRAIGVSNFPSGLLDRAFDLAPIVTDQVEHHPYLDVAPIRKVLAERGGFLTAYAPLGLGAVLDNPTLREIAAEHGVGPAQVTLRWLLQQPDTVAIPRSSKPDHLATNIDVFGFALDADEVAAIDALACDRRYWDPSFAPAWD